MGSNMPPFTKNHDWAKVRRFVVATRQPRITMPFCESTNTWEIDMTTLQSRGIFISSKLIFDPFLPVAGHEGFYMSLTRKALSNRLANLVSKIRSSVVDGKLPDSAVLGKDGKILSSGDPIALSLIACHISQSPHPVRIAVREMSAVADVWGILDFPGAVEAREVRLDRSRA